MVPGWLPDTLTQFLATTQQPVDFAIVDANHTYANARSELRALHPYLRPGGYVFCHDYRGQDPVYEGVVTAVDEFANQYGYERLPLNPSQWLAREVVCVGRYSEEAVAG